MKITALLTVLFSSLLLLPTANAQVSYAATDISGSTWQYTYTVTNNLSSVNLSEFTTFFALGEYSNLTLMSAPGNWSPIVAQPDPGLPADGFYDSVALDSGLTKGSSQGGFSVEFTYNGPGTPGSQVFNFVDSNSFATLGAGQTTLTSAGSGGGTGGTVGAPEIDPSSSVAAMTLLLGALAVMRGRRSAIRRG